MLLEPIVNTPGEELGDLTALELLLRAADYHDYSIAEHSFEIWFQLSEALYYLNEYEFDAKRELFKPYVERYITILYKHCQFDVNTDKLPPDTDEFMEFRSQASESVKDVAFVLGTLNLVEKMVELILSDNSWNKIESGLFIIKSAAGSIVNTDESVAPKLLEIVLKIPSSSNSIILTTGIELVGELHDWLSDRAHQISLATNWLLSVPLSPQILKAWAQSLQKLTSKGYVYLRDYFDRIHSVLGAIETCETSLIELEEAAQEILKAVTNLLNDRPSEEISLLLGILLNKPLDYLNKICSSGSHEHHLNNSNGKENDHKTSWQKFADDPIIWLDRITCIYRMLKPWQDQAAYRQFVQHNGNADVPAAWYEHSVKVWQNLSATFDRFKSSSRIMEHCCRTTRFVIRSMGTQSIVFIEELALKLVTIYSEYPHSCILYLCSIVVDEYGSNQALEHGLVKMLNLLTEKAFVIFTDPKNGPRSHPETIDDLFRLAVRFCYRMPAAFFGQEVSEEFMKAAVHTVELDHPDANKSVVQFLTEILSFTKRMNFATSDDSVKKLILTYGEELLYQCLQASIFTLSASLRYDVANLIKILVQLDSANSYGWLDSAISRLPKDSGLSATTEQLLGFKQNISRASRTGDVAAEVAELTRLYT